MFGLTNGKIVGEQVTEGKTLWIKGGRILEISDREYPGAEVMDVQGAYIAPGFIDIHTHGAGGCDFMDGSREAVKRAALTHMRHGTTTLLPTTLSCDMPSLEKAIRQIGEASRDPTLPNIPGVHLEGPFFSPEQSGAQNPAYLTPPVREDYERIIRQANGFIRRWSFAPELPGAGEFCSYLTEHNIAPSIGHSNAQYREVLDAYDRGCRMVTHLYSGMSTVMRRGGYRVLGVVESAFLLDGLTVEVIADGCHLPPELLQMIVKIKGSDRVCLVTDSMRGAGMPEGPSILGRWQDGLPCIIEEGVAKLTDRSAFAGSTATFDRLVRVCFREAGIPLTDCVKMASATPAEMIGLGDVKGRLEEGYDADIVVFDADVSVKHVFVRKGGTVMKI